MKKSMEVLIIDRLRMNVTLLIAIYIVLARVSSCSSNCLSEFDMDLEMSKESINTQLKRKSREAVSNGELDKEIDKLITDASNVLDNIKQESKVPGKGGTFMRPSSNSKSTMFDNEIKKIKKEIETIKSSLSASDSLRVKVNSFEDVIRKVEKDFEEKNREFAGGLETVESFMNILTDTVVNISRELNEVKRQIIQASGSDDVLGAAIIAEVKSRNFESAYAKMQRLKDPNKINLIVHEIYSNNDGNFELILQFGDSIKFVESSFRVYKALNYQMEYNNHDDPLKLVKLIDSMESQIINQSSSVRDEATGLNEKLKSLLKDILVRKMKDASKNGNYERVSSLSDRIFLTQPKLFNEAVKQVANENFNQLNPEDFVKYFSAHKYIGQSIYGYAAVFNELKSRGRSDDKAMIIIALKLKHLMLQANYGQVSEDEQIVAANTKGNMTTSLKNLAFASRVCIKNNDRAEYLYAAGDAYKADYSRRTVLTWIKGTPVTQGDWIIEPDGDVFYIKNYIYNEYLYAASDAYAYDKSRRNVYTWIPGDRVTQGRWIFQLTGPNVYIKNYEHSGYLFADQSLKLDSGRRRVYNSIFSSIPMNPVWKILDCS